MSRREATDRTSPIETGVRLERIRHVVLLGLMGSGKTAVGRPLARELGVRFDDNDGRLAVSRGVTPRELRQREGEAALHALEAEQLLDAVAEDGPTVIGAAASIVENEACRDAMRQPDVGAIWLRARAVTVAIRFHNEPHRPVYSDDLETFFEAQLSARAPLYLEVCDSVVDTDELRVDEVVARVLGIVAALEAGGATTR